MKIILITVLTAICFTLTGCGVSQEDYNKLRQENASLSYQVSKITAERDEYKNKYEQVAKKRDDLAAKNANLENKLNMQSKPIPTDSVITNFQDLQRSIKRIAGQTVTVKGTMLGNGVLGQFCIHDDYYENIFVDADAADYELADEDVVVCTGTIGINYRKELQLTNCTLIKRIR